MIIPERNEKSYSLLYVTMQEIYKIEEDGE